MGGIDDLVDDVENSKKEDEVQSILDEMDIESKDELQDLEEQLDQVEHGLLHYDSRIEELEQEIEMLRSVVIKLLKYINNENDTDNTDRPSTDKELLFNDEDNSDSNDGLDW